MNNFEKEILRIIKEKPGIKARDIADSIGCDRRDVNSALYGTLKGRCYQDSAYKWYINGNNQPSSTEPIVEPDKQLADICRYYLNCLSLEENNGISAFLTSKYSLEYSELPALNVDSADENIANLINKVSNGRNLTAHMGYPVSVSKFYSTRTNQEYFKIAPVFLFPVEISGGAVSVAKIPHVNMEIIKQYSSNDVNSSVYDLIELENELGLTAKDADIDLDEMVARLQAIRQWQWKDNLDPSAINIEQPVQTIEEEGIYNKAIFIVTERSPYTVGLESELSQLAQLDEDSYKNTALFDWIHNTSEAESELSDDSIPLLEVLPMNSEQEQAVRHSLNNKLTIVTGPPGTGKSQVVTNLLVNVAWNGKNVLFTSKNNKAVDVVESRVNCLGKRPIMLRIGGNQYAFHLSELISDLISNNADQSEQYEYKRYESLYHEKVTEYQKLKAVKDNAVSIRNHVDHIEQKVCELRNKWSAWINNTSARDIDECETALEKYSSVYKDWLKTQNWLLGKVLWPFVGKKKTSLLDSCLKDLNKCFDKYNMHTVSEVTCLVNDKYHEQNISNGEQLLYALRTIVEYREALSELTETTRFEEIDRQLINIKADMAEIAEKLWNKWLITRQLQIDTQCRREMNEYVSAMRLIGDVDLADYPNIRTQFKHLQQKMTAFLPCWAVTSLSAKGKIPFQPGIFDMVVIDEASQCDIASVLPMLYRAKRAVIIGDPKQLSHISTVSKTQDLSLLQKHDVSMAWSYSANSLYARASSMTLPNHIIQLRDHHRSYGDIIEFSNAEFYDGKLRVATNYDKLRFPKNSNVGIRWVDVIGEAIRPQSGGAYNAKEALAVVKEIRHLVIDNGYDGSVGVVTPFRAQAECINKEIEKDQELKRILVKNNFLVDTVHKFQGDERDVMLFSPVISKGSSQGALGFLKNTGNLFNVAITRARASLIVVGNSRYCSKCGVSYMEHFVEYANRIKVEQKAEFEYPTDRTYPEVSNPEQVSDWEKVFYTALYDSGIKTIPQYSIDKYKLDLAIIKGDCMLDIEVDGEMYHKDWNGELSYRDQLRNQRLFELGWDVKRFWVYEIRDNLQECIDKIKVWIENN